MRRCTLLVMLFSLCTFVILSGQEFCDDNGVLKAAVRSRIVSEEQRAETFVWHECDGEDGEAERQQQRSCCGYLFDLSNYPGLHTAVAVGVLGEMIEIEDGSIFTVGRWGQRTVAHWPSGSLLYITPSHGYFFGLIGGGYDLCLINAHTLEAVNVNLAMGPYLYGENSKWIIGIDDYEGIIALCDGSVVQIDPSDWRILGTWLLNEHVIIGSNDGSHHYCYPNILANVASVDYVRVRFIN